MNSSYDAFAWFYDRYWAAPMQTWQTPALERLLYSRLQPGALVLDLCCGAGHLAQDLARRGYAVVGLDASQEMLRLAAVKVPDAQLVHADAASFALDRRVDAAVCGFDSLNHILRQDDLLRVFRNVHAALRPGGCFVFDVNTSGAYGERWSRIFSHVEPDHAMILRGGYDETTRTGTTEITMFRLQETWQRTDTAVLQRPWEPDEIEMLLASSGFTDVFKLRAIEELGMAGHYGLGRVYFCACSKSNNPGKS